MPSFLMGGRKPYQSPCRRWCPVCGGLGRIDLLIGLGGGSAMDCAKGINFILTNGGRMEDYWGVDKATEPMLPSLVSRQPQAPAARQQSFALISQEGTHQKMACGDKKARFRTVILDPVLTTTTPQGVTAATGIDAISMRWKAMSPRDEIRFLRCSPKRHGGC